MKAIQRFLDSKAAELTGFGHNYGDSGVNKAFGNLGQVSYGNSGHPYQPQERIAMKTVSLATAGALAFGVYELAQSTGLI